MSGRSGLVRKEKQKAAREDAARKAAGAGALITTLPEHTISYSDMRAPGPFGNVLLAIEPRSLHSSGSDETGRQVKPGYAQVVTPQIPDLSKIGSGIEKSSLRTKMDKKSEDIRNGIANRFKIGGSKKNENDGRPISAIRDTAQATQEAIREASYELDGGAYAKKLPAIRYRQKLAADSRLGATSRGKHEPSNTEMFRFIGRSLSSHPGQKGAAQSWVPTLRDQELYDYTADTEIYLPFDLHRAYGKEPTPSLRMPSQILSKIPSRFIQTKLAQGYVGQERDDLYSMPPSPVSTASMAPSYPAQQGIQAPPPTSDRAGVNNFPVHYRIYLNFPNSVNKDDPVDVLRYNSTTRNFFAVLPENSEISLIGRTLYETLTDLKVRLQEWYPAQTDTAGLLINHVLGLKLTSMGDDAVTASSILAWSAEDDVKWEYGWIQSYVHLVGMRNRFDGKEPRGYSNIYLATRSNLELAAIELEERVLKVEKSLESFNLLLNDAGEKLSSLIPASSPCRAAYDSFRKWLCKYFEKVFGAWPPRSLHGDDFWLCRDVGHTVENLIGSLYDYLVDRDVYFEESEEQGGRKWEIVRRGDKMVDFDRFASNPNLSMMEVLRAFDRANGYPSVAAPYPRVPPSIPIDRPKANIFKAVSRPIKTNEESPTQKNAQRKMSNSYSQASNINLVRGDKDAREMAESFDLFEQQDRIGEVDPFEARRARWVLIYGILQHLATIAVEVPGIDATPPVTYHLSGQIKNAPVFVTQKLKDMADQMGHTHSYCWRSAIAYEKGPPNSRTLATMGPRGPPKEPYIPRSYSDMTEESSGSGDTGWQTETDSMVYSYSPPVQHPTMRWHQGPARRATVESDHSDRSEQMNTPRVRSPRSPGAESYNHAETFERRVLSPDTGNISYSQPGDRRVRSSESEPRYAETFDRVRSPGGMSSGTTQRSFGSGSFNQLERFPDRKNNRSSQRDQGYSNTGYSRGIERLEEDEWPVRDESRDFTRDHSTMPLPSLPNTVRESSQGKFKIKDFDDLSLAESETF